ncbi:cuticle-degrading protease [Ceratobasidium sp. AG-Ba]|nr:cuticle-degrading protease [Ceratobasidium sp. AG-Ba]
MRTTTLFLALVTSVIAAPSSSRVPITKRAGPVNGDSYLVKLKPGVSNYLTSLHSRLPQHTPTATPSTGILLTSKAKLSTPFENQRTSSTSSKMESSLDFGQLEERADANGVHLSKRTGGLGVDFYQIDTGIYTAHTQFGGRAKWGATFGGIRARTETDTAQRSPVSSINWVISTANSTGRPSLISITVTIAGYKPFDDAVASATSKGIHVVVAAGDTNEDASGYSPGRAPSAVTVGAILSNGLKLSTSNFGSAVDIWGPGATAKCAWISSPTASVNLIGTTGSAASNVAGILGVEIEKYGNKAPAALEADLKSHAKTVNGFLVAQPW